MLPASDPLVSLLARELAPGEHIQWSGRPDPAAAMVGQWLAVPFAVLWLAITINGFIETWRDGHHIASAFVLIFVAIGIFVLFAPLIEYVLARRTAFAITERRLLVVSRRGRLVKSVLLSGVRQVERVIKRRGVTLRIPTALINDAESGSRIDYIQLHGLRDWEPAYRLLTQSEIRAPSG